MVNKSSICRFLFCKDLWYNKSTKISKIPQPFSPALARKGWALSPSLGERNNEELWKQKCLLLITSKTK
jgi:hypothetical protein